MKLLKEFYNNKKIALDEEQSGLLEEATILEAEKIVEDLKSEEEEARSKLLAEFEGIFSDLPVLI
ncbi:hypothetical protein PL373_16010 [Tenacibaculum maritimum]|nr:hypothetical protein [Tenacibaculum maritimum]MDB0602607.1 hypothetical protein [Tenacibaculum maritimum]MDB0611281.1 hypothetical protein [Tenacibaculum maritimum]